MTAHKQTSKQPVHRFVVVALSLLLPALMGGCPEFRNAAIGSVDAAAHSVLLTDIESQEAGDTAADGILSAALDLFFDHFRADETR